MHSLVRMALATIQQHALITPGDRILVGVSGGPDSLALLHALVELREELQCTLHVAHLDHRLRGQESEADARFVSEHADRLGLPVTMEAADVTTEDDSSSLEARARAVRYAFFERVADQVEADRIALGHNADDQAETVLMRVLRGAGISGLAGIPIRRERYIRPLLNTPRSQIEAYLAELQLTARQDASNQDTAFLRNRIRHELLPLLETEYNPSLRTSLRRLAELAAADDLYLDSLARERLTSQMDCEDDGLVSIDLAVMAGVHLSLKRRMVRLMLEQVHPQLADIGYEHIEAILELVDGDRPNARLDLPHSIQVVRAYDRLSCRWDCVSLPSNQYEIPLVIPGTTPLPTGRLVSTFVDLPDQFPDGRNEVLIDAASLADEAVVRTRRPGDRFQPFGMDGHQKLKDFLMAQRVPLEERDQIPLVVSGEAVLWVVGFRLSETCRVTEQTRRTVRLQYASAREDGKGARR